MERIPEPELMNEPEQARAYAEADFAEPHNRFVELLAAAFPALSGEVLDLGCGPADITIRVARAFPACVLHGVDGAEAMLAHGSQRVAETGLSDRIRLTHGYLPEARLPCGVYDAVISNSLLHHLADPQVLWQTIAACGRPGAAVFVMDLLRPASRDEAAQLMDRYAADAPEVLRHDFYHSLLAAYRPDEVEAQLAAASLSGFRVEVVSDRHLTVSGRLAG